MTTNVKVAGITFHPFPEERFLKIKRQYDDDGVPSAEADALLIPEPNNPHDPDAVRVMVPLDNGEAFHIGYLPKDSSLKTQVKRAYPAVVKVKNFAMNDPRYSPSWMIIEVIGL